jgi:hypothetical protein
MSPRREERDENDVSVHLVGQGFPDALEKLIDEDIGNTGDIAFRGALADLLKSYVTRFGPKTYVDLHCEVRIEYRGHNE